MSKPEMPAEAAAYLTAMIDLIRRTGVKDVQIRYSDDEEPTVWMAVATWAKRSDVPSLEGPGKSLRVKHLAECAAAIDPIMAVYRLTEDLIDFGRCTHCHRPTLMWESYQHPPSAAEMEDMCIYVYDPVGGTFPRGCER